MMKLKLDANQQEAVMKELCLDASFAEVDMTNMTEVSGGASIITLWPPPYFPTPKPPITTMAIGEEGLATTLAIGEEGWL